MPQLRPQIGPYRPFQPLDDASLFAEVYLARRIDDPSSEPVVIKWIRRERAPGPQYRESFYRELRLGILLDHPGIVNALARLS